MGLYSTTIRLIGPNVLWHRLGFIAEQVRFHKIPNMMCVVVLFIWNFRCTFPLGTLIPSNFVAVGISEFNRIFRKLDWLE